MPKDGNDDVIDVGDTLICRHCHTPLTHVDQASGVLCRCPKCKRTVRYKTEHLK